MIRSWLPVATSAMAPRPITPRTPATAIVLAPPCGVEMEPPPGIMEACVEDGAEPAGGGGINPPPPCDEEPGAGAAPPQLLCPLAAHQPGRGEQAGGAFGITARAFAAVPAPHLPSGWRPRATCTAHTVLTLAGLHGSSDASARSAGGAPDGSGPLGGALAPQLLCPLGAHHAGRGEQGPGAPGYAACAFFAVPAPHLPSAWRPSAVCARQTNGALAGSHGSPAARSACTASLAASPTPVSATPYGLPPYS